MTATRCWHDVGPRAHLDAADSRAFTLVLSATEIEGFLICRSGRIRAWLNRCPHTGVTLNWGGDVFLDPAGDYIQCSMHGALFRPEDGFCVHGPCVGRSLTPLSVRVRGGRIKVALPPELDPGETATTG